VPRGCEARDYQGRHVMEDALHLRQRKPDQKAQSQGLAKCLCVPTFAFFQARRPGDQNEWVRGMEKG